jgi:hypothetical protein
MEERKKLHGPNVQSPPKKPCISKFLNHKGVQAGPSQDPFFFVTPISIKAATN